MFSSLCSDCRKALKAASPPARGRGAVTRGARAPGSDEANGSQEPGGFPRLCIPRSFVGFLGDVSLNHVRRLLGPGPARAGTSLARRRFVSEMPLQASNAKGLGRSHQGRPRRKPRHPLLCGERRCCPRSLREPWHARQRGGRGATAGPPQGPRPPRGQGGDLHSWLMRFSSDSAHLLTSSWLTLRHRGERMPRTLRSTGPPGRRAVPPRGWHGGPAVRASHAWDVSKERVTCGRSRLATST